MKLFLERDIRTSVALASVLAFLAACSGGAPLPGAQSGAGQGLAPQGSMMQLSISGTSSAIVSPANSCSNPSFPLVCVKQGGSGTLDIKLTCYKSGQKVKCGAVHWSAKTTNKGLTTKFAPNPGDPTKETVRASKTIKVGHYFQYITACIKAGCSKSPKYPIYVLK